MSRTVEVEFDTPHNNNISFLPLGIPIRGRFLLSRVSEPTAGQHLDRIGAEIPGQRILLDFDKAEGSIIEPLLTEEYREVKHRLESRLKVQIPDPGKPIKADVATWAYWLRRFVSEGTAKIVRGAIPDNISGTPILSRLHRPQPAQTKELEAVKAANETLQQQLASVLSRLDAVEQSSKRKTG